MNLFEIIDHQRNAATASKAARLSFLDNNYRAAIEWQQDAAVEYELARAGMENFDPAEHEPYIFDSCVTIIAADPIPPVISAVTQDRIATVILDACEAFIGNNAAGYIVPDATAEICAIAWPGMKLEPMPDPLGVLPEREWSGAPDPEDPDNVWRDDATGERVNAHTGDRMPAFRVHNCALDEYQLERIAELLRADEKARPHDYDHDIALPGETINRLSYLAGSIDLVLATKDKDYKRDMLHGLTL